MDVAALIETRLGRTLPTIVLTAVSIDLIVRRWERDVEEGRPALKALPTILQKPVSAEALLEALGEFASRPHAGQTVTRNELQEEDACRHALQSHDT